MSDNDKEIDKESVEVDKETKPVAKKKKRKYVMTEARKKAFEKMVQAKKTKAKARLDEKKRKQEDRKKQKNKKPEPEPEPEPKPKQEIETPKKVSFAPEDDVREYCARTVKKLEKKAKRRRKYVITISDSETESEDDYLPPDMDYTVPNHMPRKNRLRSTDLRDPTLRQMYPAPLPPQPVSYQPCFQNDASFNYQDYFY